MSDFIKIYTVFQKLTFSCPKATLVGLKMLAIMYSALFPGELYVPACHGTLCGSVPDTRLHTAAPTQLSYPGTTPVLDIGVESCMVEMTVCFLRVTITYVNKYNTIQYIVKTINCQIMNHVQFEPLLFLFPAISFGLEISTFVLTTSRMLKSWNGWKRRTENTYYNMTRQVGIF